MAEGTDRDQNHDSTEEKRNHKMKGEEEQDPDQLDSNKEGDLARTQEEEIRTEEEEKKVTELCHHSIQLLLVNNSTFQIVILRRTLMTSTYSKARQRTKLWLTQDAPRQLLGNSGCQSIQIV